MARKIIQELGEIINPNKPSTLDISDQMVARFNQERLLKEHFNKKIYGYLRNTNKSIADLSREDIDKMSKGYNRFVKQQFLNQVIACIKTNRGKPLKRIKDNHKSVLLNEIEDARKAREENQIGGGGDPHTGE